MSRVIFAIFFLFLVHYEILGNSQSGLDTLIPSKEKQLKDFIRIGKEDPSSYKKLFSSLQKDFSSNNNQVQLFELYDLHTDYLSKIGDYDSLIQTLHTMRGLLSDEKKEGLISIYIRLAFAHDQKFNFDSLIYWQHHVENEVSLNSEYRGMILLLKGLESSYNAAYSKSIEFLLEAAKIFEERNQSANLAKAYQSMAFDFHQMGDFESQEFYLLKQIQIEQALGNSMELIEAYNNLGVSYKKRDSLDRALFYYELANQELTVVKSPFLTAQNLTNRANIFEKLEDYPAAESLFLECEQLSEQHDIAYGVLLSNVNLGNLYRMMKKYSLSEARLNKALSLAKSLKFKKEEALVFERLAWLERDRGAFDAAYDNLSRYYSLNDSLVNESVRNTATELKTKYESEKKENEIIRLSNDKLYQQYIMALMGVFLVMLLFVIYWWRNKNQLIQVKLDLAENLNQVKSEALKLRENDLLQQTMEKVALKDQMQDLVNKIKEGTSNEKIENQVRAIELKQNPWNDLVEKFKLLHPQFIEKLTIAYPQLTQNDLELCSLIKMNLSTKEIGQILRITDQSVRTKKYRLLKKLDLTRETDLATWVNTLEVQEK
ncbi:tetratricopeptide repeat protein [Belliella aquatica]|uniref:HTH luxR-type domain-containing protein n=1 Tax=Belliella aquatica TaxID=1323734 RepID=A0ABQ1N5S4_9BACT|nr:LuxR C-terminal-related transcriptional regulator [Belliella aquatica]MCH7407642.1 LuxR C-terminal-related transcriptional regulator [Belliella aquatica]GGC55027.1 hypothetical protein GCM10010993_36740 [Belliella aquatica]